MTQDRRRGFQGPVITTQQCSRDRVSVEPRGGLGDWGGHTEQREDHCKCR